MKLGFFSKIYLAITDFRLYPYIVQKEKFINALAYFVAFIFIVSITWSTGITVKVLNWTSDFIGDYNTKISEFSVESGELILEENMNFEFYGVQIYADDSITSESLKIETFDNMDCNVSVLALKDALVVGSENSGYVLSKYNNDTKINKALVYDFMSTISKNPIAKIIFAGIVFGAVFVAYLLTKLFNLIGISIMLLFLGYVFRTKYKFIDYFKVACYVITLPIITEVLALLMTGSIGEYAYITYYLLLYIYMYYAIRALKLDDIIMTTQEKLFGKKKNIQNEVTNEDKKEINNNDEKADENKAEKDNNTEVKAEENNNIETQNEDAEDNK